MPIKKQLKKGKQDGKSDRKNQQPFSAGNKKEAETKSKNALPARSRIHLGG